jgi:desulfoferrodoxin (superoxide reductase-like protein)
MTEKSFIKWLRRFLDKTNIKELEFRNQFNPTYNHTSALREIYDKLENIKDGKS